MCPLSVNSLEFFILGVVFVLFYDFFFKYPLALPQRKIDEFLDENEVEGAAKEIIELPVIAPLFFLFVFLLDLSFFALSFFNLPVAIAFMVIDAIRMWRKEPQDRVLNMKDIIMINIPLLFRLYVLMF